MIGAGWIKKALLTCIAKTQTSVMLPFARWCAQDCPEVKEIRAQHALAVAGESTYIEADARVTPLVLMRAWQDLQDSQSENATSFQAELNGCLEALRAAGTISGASASLFGSLLGAGCNMVD